MDGCEDISLIANLCCFASDARKFFQWEFSHQEKQFTLLHIARLYTRFMRKNCPNKSLFMPSLQTSLKESLHHTGRSGHPQSDQIIVVLTISITAGHLNIKVPSEMEVAPPT